MENEPLTERPGLWGRPTLCRGDRPLLEAGCLNGQPILVLYQDTVAPAELPQVLQWLRDVWTRVGTSVPSLTGHCTHWDTETVRSASLSTTRCRACGVLLEYHVPVK